MLNEIASGPSVGRSLGRRPVGPESFHGGEERRFERETYLDGTEEPRCLSLHVRPNERYRRSEDPRLGDVYEPGWVLILCWHILRRKAAPPFLFFVSG